MMSSTTMKREYPPRMYPAGKSPLQNKSMNHCCSLSDFKKITTFLGHDIYDDIRDNSQVGVLLKLASSGYIWCAQTVHHFLTHQLAIESSYEIWSLIGGRPVRFSLLEFAVITGLNCDPIDAEDKCNVDHTEFWGELQVKPEEGPSWEELVTIMPHATGWPDEKKKRLALLFILSVGVLGLNRGSRIPLIQAKRVMDLEAFERYPWGRVGFEKLIKSVQVVNLAGDSYVVHGCVHVLLIWAYESVLILGESFGRRIVGIEVPLLRWGSGRRRYVLENILEKDKKESEDKKVWFLILSPKISHNFVW